MARISEEPLPVRPELVTYAASHEELELFVNSGADAVIIRYKDETERRSRGGFSRAELSESVRYCRVRGVRVYASFDSLYSDGDLPSLIRDFEAVCSCGVDAVRLRDPGAVYAAARVMPKMPVHVCGGLCLEDGMSSPLAGSLHFSRVCLGPAARLDTLTASADTAGPELEATVLSLGCSAAAGMCYLSDFVPRTDVPDGCGNVCRQPFGRDRRGFYYPLCARPVCLLEHLEELCSLGVSSVLADCREIAPDLAAQVIRSFYDAVSGKAPDKKLLQSIRSACGAKQMGTGSLRGRDAASFFAAEPPVPPACASSPRRKTPQMKRVDVAFSLHAGSGRPLTLVAADRDGNIVRSEGAAVYSSGGAADPDAAYRTIIYRTGDTPYNCAGVKMSVEKGCIIDKEELSRLRDRALLQLTAIRGRGVRCQTEEFHPGQRVPHGHERNSLAVELSRKDQLSGELASLGFDMLYLPLEELCSGGRLFDAFRSRSCSELCAVMPRLPSADMLPRIRAQLTAARELGVERVLCSDLGGASIALREGFRIRGDWCLNVRSSLALKWMKDFGFEACTPSLLCSFDQIKKLSHELEIEVFAYGRIPLMVTQMCVSCSESDDGALCGGQCLLKDSSNMPYPVLSDPSGTHCVVYDRRKLTSPGPGELADLGADVLRLHFTGENSAECVQVTSAFIDGRIVRPNGYTYGRYVEKKRGFLSKLQRGGVR